MRRSSPIGSIDGAGQDMRADLGAFLDDDDGNFRRDLLEPYRGGKAGRPGADDDDIEFHRLAGGKFRCIHDLLRNWRNHGDFERRYLDGFRFTATWCQSVSRFAGSEKAPASRHRSNRTR